jgi:peptide/nickel transport system permease protein
MRSDLTRIARNPALWLGLLGMIAILVIGVFGGALAPQDPNAQHWILEGSGANGSGVVFPPSAPDATHLLGTDPLGRDQFSRLLVGARTTLTIVLVVALVRLGMGVAVGLTSGWRGGIPARVIATFTATFAAIPQLLLAVLFILVLRPYGIVGFIAALAVIGWPAIAEFVRVEVARVKTTPFIEAARSLGARDSRLIRLHVFTVLGPRLLTLAALETGGVLLLLAELGLIGLFLAGATYYLKENGLPVLPLRDRAPEWGQMLGGIQFYAAQDQIVVLIPALFIVLAAVAFTLLADGLRIAGDPFGTRPLRPRTYGILAKALAASLCLSAVGFAAFNVRPAPITFAEGRDIARQTAERQWPGSVFVAGVARYASSAHAMERPQKLTYYFRGTSGVLRISFQDGDRLAIDVREYESEDEIDFSAVQPIAVDVADYANVLSSAEDAGGAQWRLAAPTYLVRVILTWPRDHAAPIYSVSYGTETAGQPALGVCCFDAATSDFLAPAAVPAPFPVPPNCPVTTFAPAPFFDTRGLGLSPVGANGSAWYRVGGSSPLAPLLGTFSPRFHEGDNEIMLQNALGPPQLVSAASRPAGAALATIGSIRTGGSLAFSATLHLGAPGCWDLRLVAGAGRLDLVLYAYPAGCQPLDAVPPGRITSACQP